MDFAPAQPAPKGRLANIHIDKTSLRPEDFAVRPLCPGAAGA